MVDKRAGAKHNGIKLSEKSALIVKQAVSLFIAPLTC